MNEWHNHVIWGTGDLLKVFLYEGNKEACQSSVNQSLVTVAIFQANTRHFWVMSYFFHTHLNVLCVSCLETCDLWKRTFSQDSVQTCEKLCTTHDSVAWVQVWTLTRPVQHLLSFLFRLLSCRFVAVPSQASVFGFTFYSVILHRIKFLAPRSSGCKSSPLHHRVWELVRVVFMLFIWSVWFSSNMDTAHFVLVFPKVIVPEIFWFI